MTRKTLFLAALVTVAASGILPAQDTSTTDADKGDPRVPAALDRVGLHYTATSNGNYSVTYDLDRGRSQVAYIVGKTETYDGVEIRELWSRAGTFDQAPSAEVMQKLLLDSGAEKIGSWGLEESSKGGYILYFTIRVPVSIADEALKSLVELAADVADQKEDELFNVDEE
jgi:hypothetical protein